MTRWGQHVGPARVLDLVEIAEQASHIRGVLRGLGVHAVDIDDVLQELRLGAWKSAQAGRFHPESGMKLSAAARMWLHGVTVNHASPCHRRVFRRYEAPAEGRRSVATEPSTNMGSSGNNMDAIDGILALVMIPTWAHAIPSFAAVGYGTTKSAHGVSITVKTAAGWLRRARRLLTAAVARELR